MDERKLRCSCCGLDEEHMSMGHGKQRRPHLMGTTTIVSTNRETCGTGLGSHLVRRFCNIFSKSSPSLTPTPGIPTACVTLRKQFAKPSEQVAAPPSITHAIIGWRNVCGQSLWSSIILYPPLSSIVDGRSTNLSIV